jgi:cholesterol oxidase
MMMEDAETFSAVVVGSGFAGSVAACRLTQAGFDTLLLERGRRYERGDFPRPPMVDDLLAYRKKTPKESGFGRLSWSIDRGLFDVRDLVGMQVVQSAGYGGGSLIYANVHIRPPDAAFADWPERFRTPRDPEGFGRYFDLAAQMLDVRPMKPGDLRWDGPAEPDKSRLFEQAARDKGRGGAFFSPNLAVHFDPKQSKDARWENAFGREQMSCTGCGECDAGCQIQAKNTLDLNYLAMAEASGRLTVRTLAEVEAVRPAGLDGDRRAAPDAGSGRGIRVTYVDHLRGGRRTHVEGLRVFVCAGAVNTTELLLRNTDPARREDEASDLHPLGHRFHGNGDGLGISFATREPAKPSEGPVITRSLVVKARSAGDDGQESEEPGGLFLVQEGGLPKWFELSWNIFNGTLLTGINTFRAASHVELESSRAGRAHRDAVDELAERWVDLDASARLAKQIADIANGLQDSDRANGDADQKRTAHIASALMYFVERQRAIPGALVKTLYGRVVHWIWRVWRRCTGTKVLPLGKMTRRLALGDDFEFERRMAWLVMGNEFAAGSLHLEQDQVRVRWETARNQSLYTEQERVLRDLNDALGGELKLNPVWATLRRPVTVHAQGGCVMHTALGRGCVDEYGELLDPAWKDVVVLDAAAFPSSVGVNPSATIAAVAEWNIEHHIRKTDFDRHVGPNARPPARDEIGRFRAWEHGQEPPEVERPLDAAWAHARDSDVVSAQQPVGIEFSEVLEGFFHEIENWRPAREGEDPLWFEPAPVDTYLDAELKGQAAGRRARLRLTVSIKDLAFFLRNRPHPAQLKGVASVQEAVETERPAEARSIPRKRQVLYGNTTGVIRIAVEPPDPKATFALPRFKRKDGRIWDWPPALTPPKPTWRTMEYFLHAVQEEVGEGKQAMEALIYGHKRIANDRGFDMLSDASTLFVDFMIYPAGTDAWGPHARHFRGIARVDPNSVIDDIAGTMRVTPENLGGASSGPDDDARYANVRAWAIARFLAFVFGEIGREYVRNGSGTPAAPVLPVVKDVPPAPTPPPWDRPRGSS